MTQSTTPTFSEMIRSYPFRVCVYALVTAVLFESVYLGIRTFGAATMSAENGPIELAQVVLALLGATGLFIAARWSPIGRAGLVMCGAAVAYAAARESDQFIEGILFDDAYKWLVGLPLAILCAVVIFQERHRLIPDSMKLMHHPAATLFAIGGIFLCFVCQILDRPEMWATVSQAPNGEVTKAVIEEYSELFAYLLVALSGAEAALLARKGTAASMPLDEPAETTEPIRIAA